MDSEARSRRRVARRVLFISLGVVLLAWVGGFGWLVVVELRTERFLSGSSTIPVRLIREAGSYEKLIADVESVSGVLIDMDWEVMADDPARHGWDWTHPVLNLGGVPPDSMINGDSVVSLIAVDHTPGQGSGAKSNTEDRFTTIAADSHMTGKGIESPVLMWYIEGTRVIVTSVDRAPRFDASAKARQWYHALADWWDGL